MKSLRSNLPILRCACGDDSIVDNPISDIRVVGYRKYRKIDGELIVDKVNRKYYVACPTCGKETELQEGSIPENIRKNLKISSFK